MQGISLEPARSLLQNFTYGELLKLAAKAGSRLKPPRSRNKLIVLMTKHISLDEVVDTIPALFPRPKSRRPGAVAAGLRLDRLPPLHGEVTVQVYSQARPALGHVLMEHGARCLVLGLTNTPLFLENRWPVIARGAATAPHSSLYAAFIRRGRIHPSAEAPPPRERPFILDSGEYQLRNSRLRLELTHSGPISFLVAFLRNRPPGRRPEYLLEPIV
jgi:hypothetical protein